MIAIIIVNWNSGDLLERCVRSLSSLHDCSITIVDNASSDSSLNFLDSGNQIKLLLNSKNIGFAAANNVGWRSSGGDPVLFLNPDIEALRGSIPALADVLQDHPEIWAVGGLPIDRNGKVQLTAYVKRFPSLGGVAAEMFFLEELWPGNPWAVRNAPARSDENPLWEVDQSAAACLMIRREALLGLDGFDENFTPAWFEDSDLCRRIRNRGGKIVLHTGARFIHEGGFSVAKLGYDNFIHIFRQNQIRYFEKHHGARAARQVRRLIAMGMALRSFASLFVPVAPGFTRMQSVKLFWKTAREIPGWSIG